MADIVGAPTNVVPHIQAAHRDVLDQQDVGRDLLNGAASETDRHNSAFWGDAAKRLHKDIATDGIVNGVRATPIRNLEDLLAEFTLAIIDAMIGAVLSSHR